MLWTDPGIRSLSSRVALTRISISSKFYFRSLPGCSISAVTRELSHAFVMQRARSALLPEHIHVTSLLRDRPRISFRGSMTLPPNLKT